MTNATKTLGANLESARAKGTQSKGEKLSALISRFPHTIVLLFLIIVAAAVATSIVPAGKFERQVVQGKTIINPTSFKYIESTPVGFFDAFKAVPYGLLGAGSIVFLILIVGGAVEIIGATGTLNSALSKLVFAFEGKRKEYALVALMLALAIIGGWLGWIEAAIPFIPLAVAVVLALGYDSMTAVGVVILGCIGGFTAGPTNMYTVGVAHSIAELPIFSGLTFRTIIWLTIVIVGIHRVVTYARMVQKDPEKSMVKDINVDDLKFDVASHKDADLTLRHKLVLGVLLLSLASTVYGMTKLGWGINEMSAVFVVVTIVTAIIGKIKINEAAEIFVAGASKVVIGGMIVGIARGIQWTLEKGNIIDTIVYNLSLLLQNLPPMLTAVGMFFVQMIMNLFIPSGSGQAMTMMPIMVPLSDILGITRQTACLAFQLGDGISNMFWPTCGGLMLFTAFGRVPYDRWMKFFWPVLWKVTLISIICVLIATAINFGPF